MNSMRVPAEGGISWREARLSKADSNGNIVWRPIAIVLGLDRQTAMGDTKTGQAMWKPDANAPLP